MYIVVELQKNGDQLSNIVTSHATRNDADSKFYQVMAAAAVSNVEKHACTIITEEGASLRSGYYEHKQEGS